ncbi:MAG: DUF6036 family nucleotidyltransferase [Lacisediminihabitans sp.]
MGRGVTGRLRVVGGAALASHFPHDPSVRVTRDIDALYWPKAEVESVARELAVQRGLSVGWLNDNARPWAPRSEDTSATDTFTVEIASVEELVAMKLAAGRVQDLNDLEILARHMGITDAEQLVRLAYEQYGEDSIALNESRGEYLLLAQQVLAHSRKRRPPRSSPAAP